MRVAIDLRVLNGPSGYRGIGVYARRISHEILPDLLNDKHGVDLLVYSKKDLKFLPTPVRRACTIIVVPKRLHWTTKRLRAKMASISERLDYLPSTTRRELRSVDRFLQVSNDYGLPRLHKGGKTLIMAHDLAPLKIPEGFFNPELTWRPYSWLRYIYKKRQQYVYKRRLKHFRRADVVLTNSNFTRRSVLKELGLNKNKVVATPLATPPMPKPNADPNHYKVHPYLFFVGGYDGRRDLDSLFEALRLIIKEQPHVQLSLAGKDFEYADRIVPLDIKHHIKLLGYISDQQKSDYTTSALALVYPTLYEGFGFPVLEAFAVDCPVITYKNSSLKEVGGDAAIYVHSPEEIAQQAIKLMQASYRKKVIAAGRKQLEKFSWQKTADKTIKALDLDR